MRVCIILSGLNWVLILLFLLFINLILQKMCLIKLWRLSRNILKNWQSFRNRKERLLRKYKLRYKVLLKSWKMRNRRMTKPVLRQQRVSLLRLIRRRKRSKLRHWMSSNPNCQHWRSNLCCVLILWVRIRRYLSRTDSF